MGKVMTLSLKETLTLTLTHNPNPYLSFFGAQSTRAAFSRASRRLAAQRGTQRRSEAPVFFIDYFINSVPN